MEIEAQDGRGKPGVEERSFARLRATAEERARIVAAGIPFDSESWQRNAVPPTPEEMQDLEEFLREREQVRCHSIEQERQAEPLE